MHELIRQGRALYWGTSEWSAQQLQEAYGIERQFGLNPPLMDQPQHNVSTVIQDFRVVDRILAHLRRI